MKEHPGKLPTLSNIVAAATIDFKYSYQSIPRLSADTSLCVIDGSGRGYDR